MAVKLIDLDKEYPLDIDGTTFKVKAMEWGISIRLASVVDRLRGDSDSLAADAKDEIDKILLRHIISIDLDGPIQGIIRQLRFEDCFKLINKLLEISSLNEDEQKN